MSNQITAIELKGITKAFGSVVANDNVNLWVKKGEILALLGENGSGKTTLMNMLSGIYKPDSGSIFIYGEQAAIHSPEDSKKYGIGMIHQHFKLVENFTAADNIWIGAERESRFLSKRRHGKVKRIGEKFGFEISPEKLVYDMSVSEKQTVEILKVLYYGAKILILDEPTAVLTLQETRQLFAVLRKMRDSGCAIIIITHKLNEVLEISDRVTILRKGQSVGTVTTKETNVKELTELMVGKTVSLRIDRPAVKRGGLLLRAEDLTVRRQDGSAALRDVTFSVFGGEILGVAGVSGCGQKELCEAIAGLQPIESGSIFYKDERLDGKTPRQIIERGISMSFIPEDRLGMGLAASLSVTDNMMLKSYRNGRGPFVDRVSAKALASRVIRELSVSAPGAEIPVRRLSGGNVQKVLIGREIQSSPNMIVTAYPVRGLDINSSHTIYNILNEQKKKGVGVLFVGEDLDVMLELCDRILVLCHGKVTGIVNAAETSKEELGLLMTDAHSPTPAQTAPVSAASGEEDPFPAAPPRKRTRRVQNRLFRTVKRDTPTPAVSFLLYAAAILAAVLVGGLFLLSTGVNPLTYYKTMITGCFSKPIHIIGFLRILPPLILTSAGIAVAFKMKFWNIGANGQFIVGAVSAATTALALGDSLPQWLTLLLMAAAGMVCGGAYGMITAVCKVRFGANETLLTLMLNYIAYYILTYLKNLMFFRKLSETGAVFRPDFRQIPENGWFYKLRFRGVDFDASLLIAFVVAALLFFYFKRTKSGYEIAVVGDSPGTARYAGMNVNKIVVRTMFVSAALAGLAGMLHLSGSATSHTLSDGISNDVGWTGITVAWLSKLNPLGICITALFMGILQKGSSVAESTLKISSATSSILQGIVLFTVLAADFFYRYQIVLRPGQKRKKEEEQP